MKMPEQVVVILYYWLVEWIVSLCTGEWWMLSDHNKENHSTRKQISNSSIVHFLKMNLRRHVTLSPKRSEVVSSLVPPSQWSSEPEISYF